MALASPAPYYQAVDVEPTSEDGQTKRRHSPISILSSLTPADKRVTLVTFVATLAANIATVIIVALAIIAYHIENWFQKVDQPVKQPPPAWVGWAVTLALLAIFNVVMWIATGKRTKRIRDSNAWLIMELLWAGMGALIFLVTLLGLLGSLVLVK